MNLLEMDLVLGMGVAIACLVIQCVVIGILVSWLRGVTDKVSLTPKVSANSVLLSICMIVLLMGNLLQIGLWALVFLWIGEFQQFSQAFYHSMVNFSTLGYGDIVMSEEYRLLGGFEASNGVLMFGLTTSFLYTVMSSLFKKK